MNELTSNVNLQEENEERIVLTTLQHDDIKLKRRPRL
jgi:hypothetical protein